jgi:hypothetical protein
LVEPQFGAAGQRMSTSVAAATGQATGGSVTCHE